MLASSSLGSHHRCVRRTACDLWVTHNNKCADMLAVVRRGPFARPTADERIEYLLTRVHKSSCGVAFARHALEHTLSFQRRVQAIKLDFLKRCTPTPLGVCHDFWDRTEAQQRGALHSHILVWFRKRRTHPRWVALRPVERVVKGDGPKQRRTDSAVGGPSPLPQGRVQHDTCYQMFDMGRVSGEMVRPIVTPGDWGGYDVEMLRIGALARTVLVRLKYLHVCSPVYCLKDSPASLYVSHTHACSRLVCGVLASAVLHAYEQDDDDVDAPSICMSPLRARTGPLHVQASVVKLPSDPAVRTHWLRIFKGYCVTSFSSNTWAHVRAATSVSAC